MMQQYETQIINCRANFSNIHLNTSFRSLNAVLDVVDTVFNEPQHKASITTITDAIKHNAYRSDGIGKVELWPLIKNKNDKIPHQWEINYTNDIEITNKQKLAETIVNEIYSWFKNGKVIFDRKGNKERLLKYSDIMILVKSRKSNKDFIKYLIRQFNKMNIPVMGNDKFKLMDSIISQDIIALCKFILFPDDDLNLANIIKSPFLNLTEDDLHELCEDKNCNNTTLWNAIKRLDKYQKTQEFLENILSQDKDSSIYTLLFYIFEIQGARKNIKARFGYLADEVLNEFLRIADKYEKEHSNFTLLSFVYFVETTDFIITRDIEQSRDEIKIITAHSSKGLESPIIILADTNHVEQTISKIDQILSYKCENINCDIPLLKKESTEFTNKITEQMKGKARKEYLRLLYVAMTRAENELYICDCKKGSKENPNCWYEIVRQAMQTCDIKIRHSDNMDGDILYIGCDDKYDKILKKHDNKVLDTNSDINEIISHLKEQNSKIFEIKIINPSLYYADNLIPNPQTNSSNLERGKIIHKLLEILPDVDRNKWDSVITTYLKNKPHDYNAKQTVLNVLNNQQFAFLFDKNSKSEVPIFGNIDGNLISGQIDRLSIVNNNLHFVDYKTTNILPNKIPDKYLQQLTLYKKLLEKIYPDKDIKGYILWTSFGKMDAVI